jgi:hypothetical protein
MSRSYSARLKRRVLAEYLTMVRKVSGAGGRVNVSTARRVTRVAGDRPPR